MLSSGALVQGFLKGSLDFRVRGAGDQRESRIVEAASGEGWRPLEAESGHLRLYSWGSFREYPYKTRPLLYEV